MTWQRVPMKERIERNCVPEALSGCWLWTSCVDSDGYGYLHNRTIDAAKNLKAHRVAYEEFIGPIPEGKYVCHTCDVRSCVNPAHLWLGTHEENQNDRIAKGRSAKGNSCSHARLNSALVLEVRAAQGTMKSIGLQFGFSPQTIHDVRTRKTWKHI